MQLRRSDVLACLMAFLLLALSTFIAPVLADTLVVGLSPDYEPLVFSKDGALVGIEPDNAREVAAALDMQLRFVELPFDELIPALNSNKIDVVMSGLSITQARKQQVDYVEPFMQVGQMAIIRASDMSRFGYPRAIYRPGVRVGVEPGTTGAQFVSESMSEAAVSEFSRPQQAFAALRGNTIDVYIHDAPTSWRMANSDENSDLFSLYRLLTKEQLAWAVRKGNNKLLQQLNQARARLERDGRLRAIQDFWIPVRVEVK
jgi:polar amino acid transport system substrate-binding protein